MARDLLPDGISNARLVTWKYLACVITVTVLTSQSGSFVHAETLLLDSDRYRMNEDEKSWPVIFTVHSLGGIVMNKVRNAPINHPAAISRELTNESDLSQGIDQSC